VKLTFSAAVHREREESRPRGASGDENVLVPAARMAVLTSVRIDPHRTDASLGLP
jgi:hypothetical protein